MVARITSGATPAGALYYNKDKIDRGEGRFLAAFNTPMQVSDERHFDIREALRCFEPYLEANRRTKNPVFHASLNPAPEDRLSNDELRQIYHMITFNAAKNAAIRNYGILPGNRANMVLLDAQTPEEAIIETAAKAYVWKDGRLIAQNGTLLPEETRSYTNG